LQRLSPYWRWVDLGDEGWGQTDTPNIALQAGAAVSLAEVARRAGFCDQSQFTRHFKRLVGVTPGQFRTPSRIA
jgi:AraC-like DNA-binding protein